jgi:hypothetical protein
MIYEQIFFLTGHPMFIELTFFFSFRPKCLAYSSTKAINVSLVTNNLLDCFYNFDLDFPIFLVIGFPCYVFIHLIDSLGIHLLQCSCNIEHIGTYDVIWDIFASIAKEASFHVIQNKLHIIFSSTF